MSGNEYIGKIGRMSIDTIADRAAEQIMRPRATDKTVCLDPDGRVTVERHCDAVPDDVVGVYNKTPGRLALWRQIGIDLRHEVGLRAAGVPKAA